VRRREFIAGFAGAAAAWPLAARAQRTAMPVIGFLTARAPGEDEHLLAAFHHGLKEAGYVEGQNVMLEYRFAENQYHRLPTLAADLVRRQVSLIAATGTPTALAAKAATTTIPIVFSTADDPVATGIVPSLNRPAGNMTGMSFISAGLRAKNLELLHELVPRAFLFGLLVNPNNPNTAIQATDVQAAAGTLGKKIHLMNASTEREIDTTFASLAEQHIGALIVGTDPFFLSRCDQLVALAARHAVPTAYWLRQFVTAGGLMSYGTSLTDAHRQVGIYIGRILKGAKPADLPVVQPTKYELIINLKTAQALGLDIPPTLLARADEVIE
jgi:putative ABC transport system substrate-binding protein